MINVDGNEGVSDMLEVRRRSWLLFVFAALAGVVLCSAVTVVAGPGTYAALGNDMSGFTPPVAYYREMKRYGVLPEELAANTEIDIYATDQAYWQSLWYKASATP